VRRVLQRQPLATCSTLDRPVHFPIWDVDLVKSHHSEGRGLTEAGVLLEACVAIKVVEVGVGWAMGVD
jgi:hypothetical protein